MNFIHYFSPVILIVLLLFLNFICKKNFLLMNYSGDSHQRFTSSKFIPLTGGVLILIAFWILYDESWLFLKISISSIFIIGVLSDLKKLNSPALRLLLQFLTIILFLYFQNLNLAETRIMILDSLLRNTYFNLFFTTFCILIIINGTNFMDGANTLVLGYYFIISCALYFLNMQGYFVMEKYELIFLIEILLILFFFNLFNKIYMGDSGSYVLGFVFSYILINFYYNNPSISPFFIILLLWYPAFENLFSIVRKINFSKSPIVPDTNHLHQLIFFYIKKKGRLKNNIANSTVGIVINSYNLLIIILALINPKHSEFLILLIILNLLVYFFIYGKFFSFKVFNKGPLVQK